MLFGTVTRLCCKSQNHLPSLWARPVYVETSAWFSKFGAKAGLMVLPYGKQRDAAMCFGERFLPSNKTLILYLSCKLHLNRVTHVILLLICFFFFFFFGLKVKSMFLINTVFKKKPRKEPENWSPCIMCCALVLGKHLGVLHCYSEQCGVLLMLIGLKSFYF